MSGGELACICCCRPRSEHRKDGMCELPSYFVANTVAPNPPAAASEVVREDAAKIAMAVSDEEMVLFREQGSINFRRGALVAEAIAERIRRASLAPAQAEIEPHAGFIAKIDNSFTVSVDRNNDGTGDLVLYNEAGDILGCSRLPATALATPTATHNAEALKEFFEAVCNLSVTEWHSGRLERFLEREEALDDDEPAFADAWCVVAAAIEDHFSALDSAEVKS